MAVELDSPLPPVGDVYVTRLSAADGRLRLAGTIETRHGDLLQASLVLKGRNTGLKMSTPVPVVHDEALVRRSFGLRCLPVRHRRRLGLGSARRPEVDDDILDAWMQLETQQADRAVRGPGRPDQVLGPAALTRAGEGKHEGVAALLTPYYTFKAKRTSFHLNVFAPDDHGLPAPLDAPSPPDALDPSRPPDLAGRGDAVQGAGHRAAFFRYLRRATTREIDAYYVIAADSPELRNVEPLGNVLPYRSKEHIRATLLADRVFGQPPPDFLYPLRTKGFRRPVRATKVFLQHGVMGTKLDGAHYGKSVEASRPTSSS